MKKYFAVLLLVVLASCVKDADKPAAETPNARPLSHAGKATCRNSCDKIDRKICDALSDALDLCNSKTNEANCNKFVDAFAKTLPKTVNCTSSCTDKPFMSAVVSVCETGEMHGKTFITERAAKTLAKLNYKKAKDLFQSDEFAAVLDGDLAEDIQPLIDKAKTDASAQE
jgi:hypothetical protein